MEAFYEYQDHYQEIQNEAKKTQTRRNESYNSQHISFPTPKQHDYLERQDEKGADTQGRRQTCVSYRSTTADFECTTSGIYKVVNLPMAQESVFENPSLPLIVVCGWPRNICANVVLLSPHYARDLSSGILLPYSKMCVWIRGSGLEVSDLTRAGVVEAQTCVVFSVPHVSWTQDVSSDESDTQAVLVQHLIHTLQNSEAIKRAESNASKGSRHCLAIHEKKYTPNSRTHYPEVEARQWEETADQEDPCKSRVLLELKNSLFIEFLRNSGDTTSPQQPNWFTEPQEDIDVYGTEYGDAREWDYTKILVGNTEYTSGNVTLEQMLYGIVAYGLPSSPYCIESKVINNFVSGFSHLAGAKFSGKSSTWLEEVPEGYECKAFGDLFEHFLRDRLKFVFGVYRRTPNLQHKWIPLNSLQQTNMYHYVVIACPPVDMELQKGDRVYLLDACPKTALGFMFSFGDSTKS